MEKLVPIFWLFIRVNLLTTSGPASVGLLYKEAVGSLMSETEFIEAVGFSSALPGSDALQLAMFVGYAAGGIPGAVAALLGTILPPTVLMLGVVALLHRLTGQTWVANFVRGLTPAVTVLMVFVGWQLVKGDLKVSALPTVIIGALSLVGLLLNVPAPVVLLAAGIGGAVFLK